MNGMDSLAVYHDKLLPPPEAADLLGISVRGLNRLLSNGELQRIKLGRSSRIAHSDVMAFIKKLKGNPPNKN